MSTEFVSESAYPVAAPGLSQVERVVDTFVAPSKTFRDILRSTAFWLPLILMVIFSVSVTQTVKRQVGFDRVTETQIHSSPKQEDALNQLPPDQRARRIEMQTKVTGYISYAFPVVLLLVFAIWALILWGSFNFGLGATTTYPQVVAVLFYAALPYLIRSILTIVVLYAGNSAETFDIKNPVGTNLAYYLPDAAPMVKALLARLDLIELWNLALVTIGMAVIAKKTIMQSAVVNGILWLIMTVFSVVGAAFS